MKRYVVLLVDVAKLRDWRAEGMQEEYRYAAQRNHVAVESTLYYPRESVPYYFDDETVAGQFAEELALRHAGVEVAVMAVNTVYTCPPGDVKKVAYTETGAFPA